MYAREELRTEMASVMMNATIGMPHGIDNHVAYVAGWLEALRADKRELFHVAADCGPDSLRDAEKNRQVVILTSH